MKTKDLLNTFSAAELRGIKKVIDKHDNQRLKPLFNFFSKAASKAFKSNKAALFQEVFERPYSAAEDYLLRNEIRLLNRLLEDQLEKQIQDEVLKSSKNLVSLKKLERYLRSSQFGLFKREWKKLNKQAELEMDYPFSWKLSLQWMQYISKHEKIGPETFQDLLPVLLNGRSKAILAEEENRLFMEIKIRYTERVLNNYRQERIFQDLSKASTAEELQQSEPILTFLANYAKMYTAEPKDRIQLLLSLQKQFAATTNNRPQYADLQYSILGSLALQYFFVKKYYQADEIYEKLLGSFDKDKLKRFIAIYFNYISNLTKMHRFKKVISECQKHKWLINSSPNLKARFDYLLGMSYLFLDKNQDAFELFDYNTRQNYEGEHYSIRFIYAIIYYQSNDVEMLERELTNIYQNFNYSNPIEKIFIDCLQFMKDFVKAALYEIDNKQKRLKFEELLPKLKSFQQESQESDLLPLMWLVRETEREIGRL